MLLFVVYLQPLLEKLVQICNGPGEAVVAYADDVTVILRDATKANLVLQCFREFGASSGAVLNLQKTVALKMGEVDVPAELTVKEEVKVLGITFRNNLKATIEKNWHELRRSLVGMLAKNRPRVLNIKQKVVLLNVFVCSKIWYTASVLPLNNKYAAEFTKYIGFYLWSGIPHRVRFNQIIRSKDKGGLGLHCPKTKAQSLLVNRFLKTQPQLPEIERLISRDTCPRELPHLQQIKDVRERLPQNLLDGPQSNSIYLHMLSQLPPIPLTQQINRNWRRIWKHAEHRTLTSEEKSMFYRLINGKLEHKDLRHRMDDNRWPDPNCAECQQQETIKHKFAECRTVAVLWQEATRQILATSGRGLSFDDLQFPDLLNVDRGRVGRILKTFIRYIMYCEETSIEQRSVRNLRSYLTIFL